MQYLNEYNAMHIQIDRSKLYQDLKFGRGLAWASHVSTVASPNRLVRWLWVSLGAFGATPDKGSVQTMDCV